MFYFVMPRSIVDDDINDDVIIHKENSFSRTMPLVGVSADPTAVIFLNFTCG